MEKKALFGPKNLIFQSPKNRIFPKGLTHAFGQRMYLFLYLFLVKIRLEIMFNNVLHNKETFLVNPCFWSKSVFFLFVVGQNRTRNNVK